MSQVLLKCFIHILQKLPHKMEITVLLTFCCEQTTYGEGVASVQYKPLCVKTWAFLGRSRIDPEKFHCKVVLECQKCTAQSVII